VPDFIVVAAAKNGSELLNMLEEHQADVLVIDLQMSYQDMTVLAHIRQRGIPIQVLVLTASIDSTAIQTGQELEVAGFALKTDSPQQTIKAIRQVAHGHILFPRAADHEPDEQSVSLPATSSALSPREDEMLAYVAKGYTNPDIAATLFISINTVRFHLKNIFAKLGVTNRTEAAAWYLKHRSGTFE
jgi:DNA-binding NarL/FixJ family response regulator